MIYQDLIFSNFNINTSFLSRLCDFIYNTVKLSTLATELKSHSTIATQKNVK